MSRYKEMGQRISRFLAMRFPTKSEAAKEIGVAMNTLTHYLMGTNDAPARFLQRLEEFGCSAEWLLTGRGAMCSAVYLLEHQVPNDDAYQRSGIPDLHPISEKDIIKRGLEEPISYKSNVQYVLRPTEHDRYDYDIMVSPTQAEPMIGTAREELFRALYVRENKKHWIAAIKGNSMMDVGFPHNARALVDTDLEVVDALVAGDYVLAVAQRRFFVRRFRQHEKNGFVWFEAGNNDYGEIVPETGNQTSVLGKVVACITLPEIPNEPTKLRAKAVPRLAATVTP